MGSQTDQERWENGHWVIGMINRERTKLWIECIPNRKRETFAQVIDPLLKRWLLRDPRIMTDKHGSYEYLSKQNTHYVINKAVDGFGIEKMSFWGNSVKVNVNKIENLWRHLRRFLRMRSAYRSPHLAHLHIAEFMYNWYELNWFDLITFP